MTDDPKDKKPAKPVVAPTQRTYGPQRPGGGGFGGGGKAQKSAAHRLGKSRKVH